MRVLCFIILFFNVGHLFATIENQPKVISRNGNLIFEAGENRNITFHMKGRGIVNINDIDLLQTLRGVQNISRGGFTNYEQLSGDVTVLRSLIYNSVFPRLRVLEGNSTRRSRPFTPRPTPQTPNLMRLRRRLTVLETKVNTLMTRLSENNCASTPCLNGGTCFSIYNGFQCQCTKGWEGKTCSQDVNECSEYAGTDQGCQNGATCQNTLGAYSCICAPGYVGTHCLRRQVDCATSGRELCDHGVCAHTNDATGYTCICDQGWKTNGVSPACTVDVNECLESRPHCSMEPPVQCVNLPGSFMCGSCPAGYTGNGFYCSDLDECESDNGGCSMTPKGSYRCGRCPSGYEGDGRVCTPKENSACSMAVCHPMADCTEYQNSVVNCVCKPGWIGGGFGSNGCTPSNSTTACPHGFCLNGGTCYVSGNSWACACPSGTMLPKCVRTADQCSPNPCFNGGTCTTTRGGNYSCVCARGYTGTNCQVQRRRCGGVLRMLNGILKYPATGEPYQHNARCAWLIQTNLTMVLNVTFKSFELERPVGKQCKFDWLQIHDGPSSSSHMIGRLCGTDHPIASSGIISSHNSLYLWFRSDNSSNHDGFELEWQSIPPLCGYDISTNSHGTIASPGSPGDYPMNRDCYWKIRAPEGKRVQLNFFLLSIESHRDCAYDFLAIYDGLSESSPLLEKFCNTSTPEPLVTPGNEVMLYFHSDGDNSDKGFQITYSFVPGVAGCGGIFTDVQGQISSPLNYEDKTYPNNLECEYLIKQPAGSRIALEFLSFHLEESDECRFDSVELYEGKTTEAPLIGRFCGTNIPRKITSEGNVVLLKFISDWSGTHPGFNLKYRNICGGRFGEPTGILQSPFYPDMYKGLLLCIYEVEAPLGSAIKLQFQDFEMENAYECTYDFLEIYDGHVTNDTSIGRFCGRERPNEVVSQYNYLSMVLQTDSSVNGRGFKANYSFVDVGCGGIVKINDTVINTHSPNDDNANHDLNCRWLIVAPEGHIIQMNWVAFDLEQSSNCEYDYVEIYDNSSAPAAPIGRYCKSIPPMLMTSGNKATIVFITDNSNASPGFQVKVNFVDATRMCGGEYHSPSGYIRSPGWPSAYGFSKTCIWKITVPTGRQIELNILQFSLEPSSDCRFDRLDIRNGGLATSTLFGSFCGSEIPKVLRSFSNQLYLEFVSDSSRSDAGFEIEWTSAATGCGGVLTSYRGSLTSPNFPEPYGENSLCGWRIAVNQGSVIQIVFTDIDLEKSDVCMYDYLEIFDGKDASGKKLGRYCESDRHPLQLSTSSNFAFIRFVSDSSNNGRGFSLRYTSLCNITHTGFDGVIESPSFPDGYPHDMNCEWNIIGSRGNKVYIEFTHFELERSEAGETGIAACTFDYVEIIQLKENSTVQSDRYCNSKPPAFTTISNEVIVRFVTDINGRGSGWRLEWSVEGCGGRMNKPRGALTSPNYPGRYPHDLECEWQIIADFGNTIELTIYDLDTEASSDCKFDGVAVYAYDELVTKLCSYDKNERVIMGHGHEMTVKFYADTSHNSRGFNASYRVVPSKCGGRINAPSSSIFSPNYPKIYGKNDACEWQITVDPTHRVQFNLLDFDLEPSTNCKKDSLLVIDGPVVDENRVLLNHCGNSLPNQTTFYSTSNEMLVIFTSDSDLEFKGFRANYTSACGSRIVTDGSGTIHLSDSMRFYSPSCSWTIISDDLTKHVTLTISHISTIFTPSSDVECFVSVKVVEGETQNGPERISICQGKAPPTIVSHGNALTIFTFANETYGLDTLIGMDILAHYTVLDNACGGDLINFEGQIGSPNYPSSYPLNVECVWKIQVAPGNSLTMNFEALDIQKSEGCADDYLELREGDASGRLIGVYCGRENGTTVTSNDTVWMKFRSSDEGTATGFLIEYSYASTNEISNSEGQIASPLYPKTYLGPYSMAYRVTVPFGFHVLITFNDFNFIGISQHFKDCVSNFKIFDGYDDNSPVILGGDCIIETPEPLKATTNVVYITANQEAYDIFPGRVFKITYKAVEPSQVQLPSTDGCGDQQIALNVSTVLNITSPGYPHGYGSGLDCNWTITSINPNYHPMLYIMEVDLEDTPSCVGDYVKISTSKDLVVWKEAGRLCNANFNGPYSLRPFQGTPHLKVNFHSDWYNNRTGFNALTTLYCGGELSGPDGVIEWIDHTEPLGMRAGFCMYNITVRPGRTIEFEFEEFYFPKMRETCDTYITFKNGQDDDSPLLGDGKYCGTEKPQIPQTSSRYAMVKFMNAVMVSTVRFRLKYREVGLQCGGQITLNQGYRSEVITSPNYPNIPNPFTECVWTVMAPAGERITVTFLEKFDLTRDSECRKEFVELRDGGTDRAQVRALRCGFGLPEPTQTNSNMLRVKFFTDVNDPKNGFKANISVSTCGGMYLSRSGYIRSPGYGTPGAYPSNANCEYRIKSPPQSVITLNMEDVSLPNNCELDHIEVYSVLPNDQDRMNDTLIKHGDYCGDHTESNLISNSNEMLIKFVTLAPNSVYNGFSIKYNTTNKPCGAEISASEGTITSPGYPVSMRMSSMCEWKITVRKGRRVSAVVEDLDLSVGTQPYSSSRIVFYNGHKAYSRIATLSANDVPRTIQSSDNTMLIMAWSRSVSLNRGFKIVFNSEEATICIGDLNAESGTIYAPYNQTAYVCEYSRTRPLNGTMLMMFSNVRAGARSSTRCTYSGSKLLVQWRGSPRKDESGLAALCGPSVPDKNIIVPFVDTVLEVRSTVISGPVNFTLNYRVNRCGGRFSGTQIIENTRENPSGTDGPIGCGWYLQQLDGVTMNIQVRKMKMTQTCDKEYLQLYNGPTAASPEFARYCGTNVPTDSINTQSNFLFIEYFSESYQAASEFRLDIIPTIAACGGIIHKPIRTIKSPGNGTYYNNMECIWEIRAETGFGIDLWFKDRFYIEESANCTKDYVELLVYEDSDYVSKGRFCGRHLPPVLNTTSGLVRIKFHTDAETKGDGFTLEWADHCGGLFLVTPQRQLMVSPNHPKNYLPHLKCNYTFYAHDPEEYITLNFLTFNLELSRGRCRYDNLTIYREKDYYYGTDMWERENTFCRNDSPGTLRFKKKLVALFLTDAWHERPGFKFEYYLDSCGGEIRTSEVIEPPKKVNSNEILANSKCIWKIYAPQGKNIIIRFSDISLDGSHMCWYDQISVFSSDNVNNTALRKAKLCGNISSTAVDLESNVGAIQFTNDAAKNMGHFKATVLFMPACSIRHNLTANNPSYRIMVGASDYIANMDCHYSISTEPGYTISINFEQFHVAPCSHNGTACSCDYIEVRDGFGPFGPLIGTFCGHETPQHLMSSGASVWIRFVTDSVNMSSGFTLNLRREQSVCGPPVIQVGNSSYILEPPRDGINYQKNLRCHWTIERAASMYGFFYVNFLMMDIQNPNQQECVDYLTIADSGSKDYVSEGLGDNVIYRGAGVFSSHLSFYSAAHSPMQPHTFCGTGVPVGYYTSGEKLYISFNTNGEVEAPGFKLQITTVSMCRNYTTSLSGRVHNNAPSTCQFYIRVPTNYTISVFFQNIYFFDNDCNKSGLKVYDGEGTVPVLSVCSYNMPNPVFSTSNVLHFEVIGVSTGAGSVGTMDFTYVATDQGRGCGGQLFNFGGTFTSPLYPENSREFADCRWDVAVPQNVRVALRFSVFDLGPKSTCTDNYVQILELNAEGEEKVVRQYCGGDAPTTYRSERSVIAVRFKKTRNFGGTGFIANYIGAHEDSGIYDW